MTETPWLADKALDLHAAIVEDLEKVRIAEGNRLRLLVTPVDQPDQDGVCRGVGWLPPGVEPGEKVVANALTAAERHLREAGKDGRVKAPDGWHKPVWSLCMILLQLRATEKSAVTELEKAMRAHPLGRFQKSVDGLGAKQLGRLLGIIGDPYMRGARVLDDGTPFPPAPRTRGQLRALCGHGDPERKPFKGMTQEDAKALGRRDAKTRLRLIAERLMVSGLDKRHGCGRAEGDPYATHSTECECSPYRLLYDEARKEYAKRVHEEQCQNRKPRWQKPNGCGTFEHPEWGAPGTPWRDGHALAAALRLVGKQLLDDLYGEAKRLHEERGASGLETPVSGQRPGATRGTPAADGN